MERFRAGLTPMIDVEPSPTDIVSGQSHSQSLATIQTIASQSFNSVDNIQDDTVVETSKI